ncbi:MAG: hypothetical protein EB023_07925 [Flavobacteriia bacterium]|nr:hypothetical protein [Flavobacteriia bacterium]
MFSKKKIAQRLFSKYHSLRDSDVRISKKELEDVKKLYIKSLIISALIGVLFVLLFYIPIYIFPDFFNGNILKLNVFGGSIEIRWIRELDNFLLTYVELYFLSILSIYMIQNLAAILDFPSMHSRHYQLHLKNIEQLSIEVKQKNEKALGLNPFLGLSKVQLFFMLIIARFKAMFSNMLIKFLLQRFASRYLLKTVIDMVGAPVYAFWNAYATSKLFRDSKYYIFSVELSDYLAENLEKETAIQSEIKKELQHLLVSVVALKREYSEINHYFSTRLIESMAIEFEPSEYKSLDIETITETSDEKTLRWLLLLFASGIIMDGHVSRREKKIVAQIRDKVTLKNNALESLEEFLSAYKAGKGIEYIQANYPN